MLRIIAETWFGDDLTCRLNVLFNWTLYIVAFIESNFHVHESSSSEVRWMIVRTKLLNMWNIYTGMIGQIYKIHKSTEFGIKFRKKKHFQVWKWNLPMIYLSESILRLFNCMLLKCATKTYIFKLYLQVDGGFRDSLFFTFWFYIYIYIFFYIATLFAVRIWEYEMVG